MAGCKSAWLVVFAVAALAAQAQENTAAATDKSLHEAPQYAMLLAAMPLACARIYPAMAEKAAAVEAGFTAHFDSPHAKKSWSQGWMLPDHATEEMKRARQERIDVRWQKMATEAREIFAPERIVCLVSHMQLSRAQCQAFVDAFATGQEPQQDAMETGKTMQAMDRTIAPCMPLVKNWPGKTDILR